MKETDLETRGLCFLKKSLQNPLVCPQTCFVVFFNGGLGSCFFSGGVGVHKFPETSASIDLVQPRHLDHLG